MSLTIDTNISEQKSIVRVPLRNDSKSVIHEKFFLFRLFKQIFLPKGYPDSVSEDYAAYQIWDTMQAFCSTICGTFLKMNKSMFKILWPIIKVKI